MDKNQELQLLEAIYNNSPKVRQRDLAEIAGLSLGMTNAILKRLTEKGWITIRRLNSRNVRYAVTPEGMEEILRRSYGYFKRTIKHVVRYRTTLEQFTAELSREGYHRLILVGKSDLDFIVEHAAVKAGLMLEKRRDVPDPGATGDDVFLLYGEETRPDPLASVPGVDYLGRLLMRHPGAFGQRDVV